MDILGPFTKSAKGHQYIMAITNRFTKFCLTVLLKSITAAAVGQTFLENWDYPYVILLYLVTDNGSQFFS